MAEPKLKSTEEKFRVLYKQMWIFSALTAVFFLLWGWLTSINAVAWLHPLLLALAVIFGIIQIEHTVMMDMYAHGFKQ